MKILISILAIGLVSISAKAATVQCKINNLSDATACMNNSVADTEPTDNGSNSALASKFTSTTVTLLTGLGRPDDEIEAIKGADFVGVVMTDGDEYHLVYYAMKKGKKVTPQRVYDLNTVDLAYDLPKRLRRNSPLAKPETYFLGYKDEKFRSWDYVKEQIESKFEEE